MLESMVHGPAGASPLHMFPAGLSHQGPAEVLGSLSGYRSFVVDRNIRHFLLYGGVASEGLRSDGVDDLPPSKSGCSILPLARRLRAGALRDPGPDRGIVRVK